jgi:hypothetical protein
MIAEMPAPQIDPQQKEGALLKPVTQALMQQSRLDGP